MSDFDEENFYEYEDEFFAEVDLSGILTGKKGKTLQCPNCKAPIENWKDLYYGTKYECGAEICGSIFFLTKKPKDSHYY